MGKETRMQDGSCVEWVDRENVRLRSPEGKSVVVWVDIEPGLFNNGRIIKSSSIHQWEGDEAGGSRPMSDEEKARVLATIQEYYRLQKTKFRVE